MTWNIFSLAIKRNTTGINKCMKMCFWNQLVVTFISYFYAKNVLVFFKSYDMKYFVMYIIFPVLANGHVSSYNLQEPATSSWIRLCKMASAWMNNVEWSSEKGLYSVSRSRQTNDIYTGTWKSVTYLLDVIYDFPLRLKYDEDLGYC